MAVHVGLTLSPLVITELGGVYVFSITRICAKLRPKLPFFPPAGEFKARSHPTLSGLLTLRIEAVGVSGP